MRLEHACEMDLIYQEAPVLGQTFLLIQPYGGEGGSTLLYAFSRV